MSFRSLTILFLLITFILVADENIDELEDHHLGTSGEVRISLLIRMAEEYTPVSLDKAERHIKQAISLSQELDDHNCEIRSLLILGDIYFTRGNYVETIIQFNKARELSEEHNFTGGVIDSYISMAVFHKELSDHKSAIEYLLDALSLVEEIDDPQRTGIIFMELSYNYRSERELEHSRDAAEKAIDLFIQTNDEKSLALIYNHQCKTFLDLAEYDKARYYSLEVLDLTEENLDSFNRAIAYNDLGWNYYKLGDFEQALEYNLKALEIRRESGQLQHEASSLINIGDLYKNWNKLDKALLYYQRSWDMLKSKSSFPLKSVKKRYFKQVSDLYLLQGDYKKAWQNYRNFHELEKEFSDLKNDLSLKRLIFQYEKEKYEKEKKILKDLHVAEIRKQRNIIYAVLIIVLLLICIGIISLLRYRQSKKFSQKMSIANTNLQSLNRKNQIELAEKQKMEKLISAHSDHLKLINRILRHDIANDLATIKSGLKVYRSNKDEAILDELTLRVDKSTKLIHNMREFEKFMSEYRHLKVIDVTEIVKGISDNYHDVNIIVNGSCKVMADDSISSVLENLIRNAVEHGEVDTVEINIVHRNTFCKIDVADRGIGIPDSIKEKLFEEGYKFGRSGNTGMGLFIVKKIIESYGGTVRVENNEPQGSVFSLYLKAALY